MVLPASDDARIIEKLRSPFARKVIAVVDRGTFERLDFDEETRKLWKRPGVLVLPSDLDLDLDPVLVGIGKRGLWRQGAILAQNPYHTDNYEQGDEPQALFARSRLRVMAEVLQALGARQLQYEEADKKYSDVQGHAEVGLEIVKRKGGAGISRKQADDLHRSVKLGYTWAGGTPDIGRAQRLLQEANLDGDDALRSLVKLRANAANPHETLTETFDLLQESSSTIELAADLQAGMASGKSKGRRGRKTSYEYKVSYKIVY